jgi:lipid-A-disaccharide synthase
MLVAGEASGDKHGAALALALRNLCTTGGVELFGSGGKEMRAAGVETVVDAVKLGIIGIPEIIRALPKFYSAYRKLVSAALARRADAVVLIDWPDFNLKLARRLSREGLKVVYYISPQVWAWRRYRVRAIRRWVKLMLVILPFEEEFYRREGVAAEYVGHPLSGAVRVTSSRQEFAKLHGLDASRPIIALLPGSRQKELYYHLPIMAEAAARLVRTKVDWVALSGDLASNEHRAGSEDGGAQSGNAITQAADAGAHGSVPPQEGLQEGDGTSGHLDVFPQFVVPLASTVDRSEAELLLGPSSDGIRLIEQDTYNALGHASAAIVASGTATVEAALLGVPMVVIYRGSEFNWRLIRPLIRLETFGMANLIAGRRIVPELIQHEVTPARIVSELVGILSDRARLARIKQDLAIVSSRLRSGGASPSELAARRVIDIALALDDQRQ